jgi:uncharacterized membrane-anchored protein
MTRSIANALLRLALLQALWLAIWPTASRAEQPDPKQVFEEAMQAAQAGPKDIALAGQATLKLPTDRVFIPQPQATQLLNAMGNPGHDPNLHGLIFPKGDDSGWFMTVRYEASGHIKDDDAKDWNADDLLKSYREGTEASNDERVKLGMKPIEILGWAEKPAYDAATHRLVWAMSSRQKGNESAEDQGVNYNTYLLGREGYFSMNLVTALKELPQDKPAGQAMLSALDFNDGKRYADFDAATDHLAEYGLAALVLGVGAKKLGLLAVAGVFVAKFAKLILLAVLGFGAAMAKFLGRRKGDAPVA